MCVLKEDVLNKVNKGGNLCFKMNNDDISYRDEITLDNHCKKVIINRIEKAFNEFGLNDDSISKIVIIGSSLTLLSNEKSNIDVAVIIDNNKFFENVKKILYSNSIIDKIIRDNDLYKNINWNQMPEFDIWQKLVYSIRGHILKGINNNKVSDDIDMKIYYIIEADEKWLNFENYYIVKDKLNSYKKYIKNNENIGVINFQKKVNLKQIYKMIIKPLFNMNKDYKFILKDLKETGEVKSEHLEKLYKLKEAVQMLKDERYDKTYKIIWKDKDENEIKTGNNGKPLDYEKTYLFMNVLYSYINRDLMAPGGDFTFLRLFDIIKKKDKENIMSFAKSSLDKYAGFKPGQFLSSKVDIEFS